MDWGIIAFLVLVAAWLRQRWQIARLEARCSVLETHITSQRHKNAWSGLIPDVPGQQQAIAGLLAKGPWPNKDSPC